MEGWDWENVQSHPGRGTLERLIGEQKRRFTTSPHLWLKLSNPSPSPMKIWEAYISSLMMYWLYLPQSPISTFKWSWLITGVMQIFCVLDIWQDEDRARQAPPVSHSSSQISGRSISPLERIKLPFNLGGRTLPDYSMAGFHHRRLSFALQCNLRSPHLGKNQSHYFYLSPDDKFFYFYWDRQGKGRPKSF